MIIFNCSQFKGVYGSVCQISCPETKFFSRTQFWARLNPAGLIELEGILNVFEERIIIVLIPNAYYISIILFQKDEEGRHLICICYYSAYGVTHKGNHLWMPVFGIV